MDTHTFHIPNISCVHCTRTIENELEEMDGIDSVSSRIADKTITVRFESPATKAAILSRLAQINYPAAEQG
ncbi:MAG: heavy-metal-associated domain-containing protein [Desulfatitalea sp.]|nr:heavy-metal-associated domain-containing protein [Desulfatitalea sp.]NNJ99568.1 heavy-metal-associated domain-containing protein [Desulfatitalea sp.]